MKKGRAGGSPPLFFHPKMRQISKSHKTGGGNATTIFGFFLHHGRTVRIIRQEAKLKKKRVSLSYGIQTGKRKREIMSRSSESDQNAGKTRSHESSQQIITSPFFFPFVFIHPLPRSPKKKGKKINKK